MKSRTKMNETKITKDMQKGVCIWFESMMPEASSAVPMGCAESKSGDLHGRWPLSDGTGSESSQSLVYGDGFQGHFTEGDDNGSASVDRKIIQTLACLCQDSHSTTEGAQSCKSIDLEREL